MAVDLETRIDGVAVDGSTATAIYRAVDLETDQAITDFEFLCRLIKDPDTDHTLVDEGPGNTVFSASTFMKVYEGLEVGQYMLEVKAHGPEGHPSDGSPAQERFEIT